MFEIRMAGLKIRLDNKYPFVFKQCTEYLTNDSEPFLLHACASAEEIEAELSLEMGADDHGGAESICLYREIAKQLHRFDALLMHGAVIGYKDRAYAFLAPSGTGKSTHIRLWHHYLGEDVFPVNGDKPILRKEGDAFTAYGTPWAGKEGWQRNIGLPLAGICLVTRGVENSIQKLSDENAVSGVLRQIYLPPEVEGTLATMALADELIARVPIYLLACNMTEDAVRTSFEALTGYEYERSRKE